MPTTDELKKTLGDATPLYAAAGTADLAVEKLKRLREQAPGRIQEFREKELPKLREQAQTYAAKARETYDELAARGRHAVDEWRAQGAEDQEPAAAAVTVERVQTAKVTGGGQDAEGSDGPRG